MALGDRIKEFTTTTGSGVYFLDGTVSTFQTFVDGIEATNGVTSPRVYSDVPYTVIHTDVNLSNIDVECGRGTLSAGVGGGKDTITRDSITFSSNGGSKVSWGEGTKVIVCAPQGTDVGIVNQNQNTFNVFNYGAIGNGVTGDSTAIQAAIDAAAAISGNAVVQFSKGTYLIDTPLVPKSGVTLRGYSGAELISDSLSYVVDGSGGSGTGFRVLGLNFTEQTPAYASGTRAIGLVDWSDVDVRDCVIQDYTQFGIAVHVTEDTAINGVKILNNSVTGIGQSGLASGICISIGISDADSQSTDCEIRGNYCEMATGGLGSTFKIQFFTDCQITNNRFIRVVGSASSSGVVLDQIQLSSFSNNHIDNGAGASKAMTIQNCREVIVSENTVEGADDPDISFNSDQFTPDTITNSTTTATVTVAAEHHFFTGDVVLVSGANESDYNGTFEIIKTSSTAFTYTMGADPGGSATGTLVVDYVIEHINISHNILQGELNDNGANTTVPLRHVSFVANNLGGSIQIESGYMDDVRFIANQVKGLFRLKAQDKTAIKVRVENNSIYGVGSSTESMRVYPDNVRILNNLITNDHGSSKTDLISVRGDGVVFDGNEIDVGDGCDNMLNMTSSIDVTIGRNKVVGTPTDLFDTIPTTFTWKEGITSFADQDATPLIGFGKIYVTANTIATTITDFDDPVDGKEIIIIIGDANTTIDFTASGLKGNVGVDWSPIAGDHMTCIYDGTDWLCSVSDNTA